MRIVIRYQCSACGWRWSRDFKAKMSQANLIPQPAPIIEVPRALGPCECEPEA